MSPSWAKRTLRVPIGVRNVARPRTAKLWVPEPKSLEMLGRGVLLQRQGQRHRRHRVGRHLHGAVALETADGNPIQTKRQLDLLGGERIVVGVFHREGNDDWSC